MKLKLIFSAALIFYLPILLGEVYKTVDEDGNIIFTDRPTTNSEEIKLKELNSKFADNTAPSSGDTSCLSNISSKEL